MTTPVAIWRFPTVTEKTGDPRSTIELRIKQGTFVPPVRTGPRSVGFPSDEVEEVIRGRIRGLGDDQIRALVRKLVRRRGAGEGEGDVLGGGSPQATAPAPVAAPREPRKATKKAPAKPKVKPARPVASKGARPQQVGA